MKRFMTAVLMLTTLSGCGSMPMHMDSEALYGTEESTAATTEPETEAPIEPETTEPEPTEPPETKPVIPPPEEIDGDVVWKNGVLVVNSGTDHPRAMEVFNGSLDTGVRYAELVNAFSAALPAETSVYCMVVPTASAFYLPEDMEEEYGHQLVQYQNIEEHLSGVTGIPLYEPLLYHRNEPIYSRSDFHWQPLGAYYAAAELAKTADVPFAPIETYDKVEREGYAGAFASINGITELRESPEVFTYYKPGNLDEVSCTFYDISFTNSRPADMFHEDFPIGSSYTVFIGTDECIFQTDTNVDNGRVLVIFKDSYGNALVPFLTESFSTIYLCDFRHFNMNAVEFVENVGATDVLFAISTLACTSTSKVDVFASNFAVSP